jgi:hypothetical protein
MPDLTDRLLPRLQDHRLTQLDLGYEVIYPYYEGGSIVNIPSSLCQLFGVPDFGAVSLFPEILSPLMSTRPSGSGFQNVILVLMDALAIHRFQRWLMQGQLPLWSRLIKDGLLAPVTSITPSTTSAALTSLWTGRSAVEHGIVGYEMWLKEYGMVVNAITHAPMYFKHDAGGLRRAGFNPRNFMSLPTLGSHLLANGVKAHAFQHFSIAHSGVSQMLFEDVEVHSFSTQADLWISLRCLLENQSQQRSYVWVYWDQLDYFSHRYGPDDERPLEEFKSFSLDFERLFLDRLRADLRSKTLLILIADHGQITTRMDAHYELINHPSLARRLHILPTGENRLMYLFVRPGQTEAVREYLNRTWPAQFSVIDPLYALHAGLFGPGKPHPRLADRLGDQLVIAQGNAYLWWAPEQNHLVGRHGGLSPDEMLVPFLAVPL